MSATEHDEIINGYFILDFDVRNDKSAMAAFKTCSGISYETEIVTTEQNYSVPGQNGGVLRSYKKRPGRINFGDIQFERGLTTSEGALEKVVQEASTGNPERQTMAIILYNDNLALDLAKRKVAHWELHDAWISGWSLSDLDATSDEVIIQTLRITHTNLVRIPIERSDAPASPGAGAPSGTATA